MKKNLIYIASVIMSTLLFVLILSFAGILGPTALAGAIMTTKIIGWLALYIIMIRIPIAFLEARERRAIAKTRNAIAADSNKSMDAFLTKVKSFDLKLKKPTIDNPVIPKRLDLKPGMVLRNKTTGLKVVVTAVKIQTFKYVDTIYEVVCEKPHDDGDFSYLCYSNHCRCAE